MAKETYSTEGNEIVKTLTVKGHKVNVYGCYDKQTKIGKFNFYDVYIDIDNLAHCMNEGEPFYKKPTKKEILDLVDFFMNQ